MTQENKNYDPLDYVIERKDRDRKVRDAVRQLSEAMEAISSLKSRIHWYEDEIELIRGEIGKIKWWVIAERIWWIIVSAAVLILYLIVLFGDKK